AAAGPSPAYALIREEIDGESKRFDEAFKQCQRAREKAGIYGSSEIWGLAALPLRYLARAGIYHTANYLQDTWAGQVYSAPAAMQDSKVQDFKAETARPFLIFTPRARAKTWTGLHGFEAGIPFTENFLRFINHPGGAGSGASFASGNEGGATQSYLVTVAPKYLSANNGAHRKPVSLLVELAEMGNSHGRREYLGTAMLSPISYTWRPGAQVEVRMTIKVPVYNGDILKLDRSYTLRDFLYDFQSGSRKLYRDEFPQHSASLAAQNLDWIEAGFDLGGEFREVINYHGSSGGGAPAVMVTEVPRIIIRQ
ncbi:MAG: hypothetical protein C4524_15040, partial [Candidatus Zixiibacteriota bacterium]